MIGFVYGGNKSLRDERIYMPSLPKTTELFWDYNTYPFSLL
jgi:hypothetical protein